MLTTLKTPSVTKWTWSGTGFVRESPGEKQPAAPNCRQVYKRARYYDTSTGEFISRDPLEYVDGMSLYRGYFVQAGVDPLGLIVEDPDEQNSVMIDLVTDQEKSYVNFDATTWWFGWHVDIFIKPPSAGMLMQYVDVDATVIACDDDCPSRPTLRRLQRIERAIEGNLHPLYEIWPLDDKGHVFVDENGNAVPSSETTKKPFDVFSWNSGVSVVNTRGKFTIDGEFSFFSGAEFPKKEPDGRIGGLPKWDDNPMEGLVPDATKNHECTLYWDFCNGKQWVMLVTSEGDVWRKSR